MTIGERITWTHEVGSKRCILIEADLSGTITNIEGDKYTIDVDSYDGHPVEPFSVTLAKEMLE